MKIIEEIISLLLQEALTILPSWGWALVFATGFIGALIFPAKTRRPRLVFFGSSLLMSATFFSIKTILK